GAKQLDLGQQAPVGEGLHRVGDRRIVDQRQLFVAPGKHMTIEGVVAGVATGAGEPAPVDAGLPIEDLFWLLVPIDVLSRLAPEAFRIALPTRIDVLIAAGADVHRASPALVFASIVSLPDRINKAGIDYSRPPSLPYPRGDNGMAKTPYDIDLDRNPANYQPLTPLGFLERAAAVFPDHVAIIHGRMRRNYAEFYARARRLASAL